MKRDKLITTLFDNLQALKRGMYASLQPANVGLPISYAQLELLTAIHHLQPISSKQLAAQLHLTPGAVSQLLEELTSQLLVERQIDPSDRRIQSLRIAPSGTRLLKTIEERRKDTMKQVMKDLTDEELETWLRIQQKLIREFQTQNTQAKEVKV